MEAKDFPKRVTKKNIVDIIEKGTQISDLHPKRFWMGKTAPLLGKALYFISNILKLEAIIILSFYAATFIMNYIDLPKIIIGIQDTFLKIVLGIILSSILLCLPFFIIWLLLKISDKAIIHLTSLHFFEYPLPKYEIFSELSSIVKNIKNKQFKKAKEQIFTLNKAFERYLTINPDVKNNLLPYLKNLKSGIFEDFILFSRIRNIDKRLLELGLSFIHEDFPKIHFILSKLNPEIEKYERKGRLIKLSKILIEYEKTITIIVLIISTIILPILFK